jgi:hypothetical protein
MFLGTMGIMAMMSYSASYPYRSDYDQMYYKSKEEADRAQQAAEQAMDAADRAEGSAQSADFSAGYAAGIAAQE